MKTLLCILILATAATQSLFAQTTTLTFQQVASGPVREQDIPVLAVEFFELLTWSPSNDYLGEIGAKSSYNSVG